MVNVTALALETIAAYFMPEEVTLLSQNITILSLCLSANTIICLFIDILKPFNDEKKKLLQDIRMTKEETELENRILKESGKTFAAIEEIKKNTAIDEDKKNEMIGALLAAYKNSFAGEMAAWETEEWGEDSAVNIRYAGQNIPQYGENHSC